MQRISFISGQRFYSFLMGISALLMFLSLRPEQHFAGIRHPLLAALLIFCGVYSAYRLSDLKPSLQLQPLRLVLKKWSPDFFVALSASLILLYLTRPGMLFLLQFAFAGIIAVSYYTISEYHRHKFGGLRSIFLIKNLSLALAWALATAPIHPGENGTIYHFGERFLYLFALSLLIDLRDLQADKSIAIRTVAGSAGVRSTRMVAVVLLAGAVLMNIGYSLQTGDTSLLKAGICSCLLTILSAFFLAGDSSPLTYLILVDGNLLLYAFLSFFFSRF